MSFPASASHIIYVFKERLAPTLDETALLARTLIVDPYDLAAGWYWFSEIPDIRSLLFYFAALDSLTEVKERATDLIARASIPPERHGVGGYDPLDRILNDDASEVRVAGLRYLERIGTMGHMPLVREALSDDDPIVRSAARRARWAILARDNPGLALAELRADPQIEAQAATSYIGGGLAEGTTDALKDIARDQRVAVALRILALRGLTHREDDVRDVVSSLLEDPSNEIKRVCCEIMIERGDMLDLDPARVRQMFRPDSYGDTEMILLALYRTVAPDTLLHTPFYSLDGSVAYRALALDHFPLIEGHIRSDLADRFARMKGEEIDALRAKLGDKAEDIIRDWTAEEMDRFLVRMYTSAALAGLAVHGEPSDVDIARRYLTDSAVDTQKEAVSIVARFGDRSDVPSLLGIIEGTYDKDLRKAATKGRGNSYASRRSPGT